MKYTEAIKVVEEQQHLIGAMIGDDEISHILIVPSNRNHDAEIISRAYWDKPLGDILSRYTDFIVIVVCDLDNPNNQAIIKYDLEQVKAKIKVN